MKRIFLILTIVFSLFAFVGASGAWDGSGWSTSKLPFIKKTSAPTVNDSSFGVPYLWCDTNNDKFYLLIDNTAGAAVWEEIAPIASPAFTGDVSFEVGSDVASATHVPASAKINDIGTQGGLGFGVGICPPQLLPNGMTPLYGYDNPQSDNYGNYQYQDGSIMVWIPRFYYLISTNTPTVKGIFDYPSEALANANSYAILDHYVVTEAEWLTIFNKERDWFSV